MSNTNVNALQNGKKESFGALANNEYTNATEDHRAEANAMDPLPVGH